jgi:hypothetical protein
MKERRPDPHLAAAPQARAKALGALLALLSGGLSCNVAACVGRILRGGLPGIEGTRCI